MNPDWRKLLSGAGIRGSESDLTDEFAARLGFACAQWLAEKLETITYEVTCDINKRVPRIFLENGEEVGKLQYIV